MTLTKNKSCAKDVPEGTENLSRLSETVRRVAKKNLRGVAPPLHGRGLIYLSTERRVGASDFDFRILYVISMSFEGEVHSSDLIIQSFLEYVHFQPQ